MFYSSELKEKAPRNIACPNFVNIHKQLKSTPQDVYSEEPNQKLQEAVERNSESQVLAALKAGADVNSRGLNNSTALNTACFQYAYEKVSSSVIIDILLSRGANPELAGDDGWCPLKSALLLDSLDLAKKLIEHGAKIHTSSTPGCHSIKELAGERFDILETFTKALDSTPAKAKLRG